MKHLPLIVFLAIAGCAFTEVENEERLLYSDKIERKFWVFVSDCTSTGGQLHVPPKRVQNAPMTIWEMKDTVCYYDDKPSRKMGN